MICDGEYDQNETGLVIRNCPVIKTFPHMPNLRVLDCAGCVNLETIPVLPKLTTLFCDGCVKLETLPVLPKLKYLLCGGCVKLKEDFSKFPQLCQLYCGGCPNITKIVRLRNLDTLECRNCTSLTEIEDEGKIRELDPTGCTWVPIRNNAYNFNIRRLITVQKIWSRKLLGRKLEKFIPEINAIYYSPECKGFRMAKKEFSSLLNRLC